MSLRLFRRSEERAPLFLVAVRMAQNPLHQHCRQERPHRLSHDDNLQIKHREGDR